MRNYDGDERKYIVLIIYDISDNKQRLKLAKFLSSYGNRVQKSAFEACLTQRQYANLISGIEQMIHEDDNIRIYRLNHYEEIKLFGEKDYTLYEDVIII